MKNVLFCCSKGKGERSEKPKALRHLLEKYLPSLVTLDYMKKTEKIGNRNCPILLQKTKYCPQRSKKPKV